MFPPYRQTKAMRVGHPHSKFARQSQGMGLPALVIRGGLGRKTGTL